MPPKLDNLCFLDQLVLLEAPHFFRQVAPDYQPSAAALGVRGYSGWALDEGGKRYKLDKPLLRRRHDT